MCLLFVVVFFCFFYESGSIGSDEESSNALESIHIGFDCRGYKQNVQTVDFSG